MLIAGVNYGVNYQLIALLLMAVTGFWQGCQEGLLGRILGKEPETLKKNDSNIFSFDEQ